MMVTNGDILKIKASNAKQYEIKFLFDKKIIQIKRTLEGIE